MVGLLFLALMYLPGMFYSKSMVKDQFWWWWVVHLWVEGAWEIIAGALLAFMLMKTIGAKREVLEKWMYIEVGLVMFTGILGTGHHYYWIGTPSYWLWVGGFFSSLEPVPLLLMVWDAFRTTTGSAERDEQGRTFLHRGPCHLQLCRAPVCGV